MRNERLREALIKAHKTIYDVVRVTGVDPKTVQRWLNGRVPHARHRWAVADMLHVHEEDLWQRQKLSSLFYLDMKNFIEAQGLTLPHVLEPSFENMQKNQRNSVLRRFSQTLSILVFSSVSLLFLLI